MNYEGFIERVHARTHLSRAEAVAATHVILKTIAEQIGEESSQRLAAGLPSQLARDLREPPADEAVHFSFGEFCQRVAIREDSNVPDAISHARCVIETLEEAVDGRRCGSELAALRDDLAPLFSF